MNSGAQPLVAEVAVDFEHLLETAHYQPFQIQLRRDAQVHLQVQAVVVGDKRPRRGAAGDHLQHRRFRLDKALLDQIVANPGDHPRANLKGTAAVFVDDQIHIALTITRFGVGQAFVFLGQRAQGFGEHQVLIHHHVQVAHPRFTQGAAHANHVAQVPVLGVFLHRFGGENLNAAGHVLKHLEGPAVEHQPAGHRYLDVFLGQLFLAQFAVLRLQIGGQAVAAKMIGKSGAAGAPFAQLGAALGDQAVFVLGVGVRIGLVFIHSVSVPIQRLTLDARRRTLSRW